MPMIDLTQAQHHFESFAQKKVPMIGFCQPTLIKLTPTSCETAIPLNNNTKNHVDSLYFGALAVGADITAGFLAIWLSQQNEHFIEVVFKDFQANFKKRALATTHFQCDSGELIQQMITETTQTQERVSRSIPIIATTPSLSKDVVAEFSLTLSCKRKQVKAAQS